MPTQTAGVTADDREKAQEDIRESEKIMQELNETWEEKKSKSEVIKHEREAALRDMGIALKDDGDAVGVFSPQKGPHLLNLSDDPLMSELLLYYISSGVTRAGRPDAEQKQHIQLSGEGIEVSPHRAVRGGGWMEVEGGRSREREREGERERGRERERETHTHTHTREACACVSWPWVCFCCPPTASCLLLDFSAGGPLRL